MTNDTAESLISGSIHMALVAKLKYWVSRNTSTPIEPLATDVQG